MVDKVTNPAGDPQSFDFALTGGPDQVDQPFSLTDAAQPYDSGDLKPQPLNDVVVDLSVSGGVALDMPACNAEGAGACLLFTAANWNQPQTVSVRVAGPGQVTHTVVSSDGMYDGLTADPVDVSLGDGGSVNSIFLPLVSK